MIKFKAQRALRALGGDNSCEAPLGSGSRQT